MYMFKTFKSLKAAFYQSKVTQQVSFFYLYDLQSLLL